MGDRFNTDDMLDVYLFENQQLLEKLELTVLEQQDGSVFSEETINELFRTIHTIKGSSGVMMFDDITAVSHKLEDIFYEIREHHLENVPHLELVGHVLKVIDFIKVELDKIQNGETPDGDFADLIEGLDEFLTKIKVENKNSTKKSKVDSSVQNIYIAPVVNDNIQYSPVRKEDEIPIFIDLESSVEEIEARAEQLQRQKQEERERILIPGDFVVQAKEPGKATVLAKDNATRSETATYVTVEVTKLDRLMELVGKLVVSNSAEKMKEISRDLQKTVISMRKVPLQGTFQKMYRVVFDASRKLGKDVDFQMDGEMIELDRDIAEHISNPLMHLIRNAIDHGLENPEERILNQKERRGKVILSAKIEADTLYVSVEDDGKGLDRDKILNKARAQGLIDEKKSVGDFTDEEIYQFITMPGFSTSEVISEYSGRGVGLDVVVSSIAAVGGVLKIESEKGKGCKMTIEIPLI
ncbi:MAG: Hpt domain-containing protein [Agathobacter sp.]|nr:Hpt domain-containing protein [Agathobacter sp.]